MPVNVLMPKLGLTMTTGKIVEWLKKEGEQVEQGQGLFVLETEKLTYEVESPQSGILGKILVQEGQTVAVGELVAYILLEGESIDSLPQVPASQQKQPQEDNKIKDIKKGRIKITPLAKKLALERGIDIADITGTGPSGRIVKADVLRVSEEIRLKKADLKEADRDSVEWELNELSSMRKTIAKRMSESFYSAPHIYFTVEVDAGEIMRYRKELLPFIEKETGCRLTITDILIKITAKALKEYPMVNASWTDEGLRIHKSVNIGVATAVEGGLLVPVIKGAGRKSLAEIALVRTDLTERAKNGKWALDEISGGTFTITNLGMYDIDFFSAIINPPESAILAVSGIKERPVAQNGQIVIRPMMYLTLSADHRVLDGAYAARFIRRIKEFVEKPLYALT